MIFIEQIEGNWYKITSNNNFDINWVSKFPNKQWDWHKITSTYNFNINWVSMYP